MTKDKKEVEHSTCFWEDLSIIVMFSGQLDKIWMGD